MARSMTAFARLEKLGSWGRMAWELRTVNHRYVEIGLRLPEDLRALEGEVRNRITARLNRGKVDCALRLDTTLGDDYQIRINEGLARQLIDAAQTLGAFMRQAAPLNPLDVLRWPGVMESREIDFEITMSGMVTSTIRIPYARLDSISWRPRCADATPPTENNKRRDSLIIQLG